MVKLRVSVRVMLIFNLPMTVDNIKTTQKEKKTVTTVTKRIEIKLDYTIPNTSNEHIFTKRVVTRLILNWKMFAATG